MDIHDYHLDAYSVNCRGAEIRMKFSWPYDETKKSKEIVFTDVAGYEFRDAMGSVIFDIEERKIEEFLEAHAPEFSETYRRIGCPQFWRSDISSTMEGLKGMRVWEIGSSIGFEGWLIARTASEADQDEACNAGKPPGVERSS